MAPVPQTSFGTLPRGGLIALIAGAALAMMVAVAPPGFPVGIRVQLAVVALAEALVDGGLAAIILVAAGGWGFLLVRRLLPSSAPTALRALTACGVGLWLLATAMLALVSAIPGLLNGWVWWPVVGGGVVLAAWQGRKHMEAWHVPERFDGRALAWVLVAAAAALWISGAFCEPGRVGNAFNDNYDVLEYHLQVPREYYDAGRIAPLAHNVYSYYPLGMETLYLLTMCLRGGPYEGMYAAQFLHGSLAVLAVACVFLTLRQTQETRARFAAVLLATTPAVIYLSRLAMVEMGELFYLVLALLWLREWLAEAAWRNALFVGAALGGACALKYLCVGLIAAPVLAAMLAAALLRRRWRGLAHVGAGGAVALLLFSPWLIRNTLATGNPVFPLATSVFGRGHWSEESDQRWVHGHAPQAHPPVPQPPGWKAPDHVPTRMENFVTNFMARDLFGYVTVFIGGFTLVMMLADRRRFAAWDFCLGGVLAMQLAVWAAFTREMPWRFIVLAMPPVCLLAGEALAKLAHLAANPFRPGAAPAGPWGRVPATALLVAAAAVNLITAAALAQFDGALIPSVRPEEVAGLPAGAKPLLIGENEAFYFPKGTLYATAFDANPLAAMVERGLTAPQIAQRLKDLGVTHVVVNWYEIMRLSATYGYSPILTEGLFDCAQQGRQPDLPVLNDLRGQGMFQLHEYRPSHASPTTAASRPADVSWPMLTIYAFPWTPAEPAASQPAK
ncbi:MAG: glycosyltransferase family 39 protein [Planctomycetota bacterium]|nr:glycosyltransferase family 39 protein [Planctomycetota bacterium]